MYLSFIGSPSFMQLELLTGTHMGWQHYSAMVPAPSITPLNDCVAPDCSSITTFVHACVQRQQAK